MLLSPRRLVFTSSQMYFQCLVQHHLESLCSEATFAVFKDGLRVFPHEATSSLEELSERLQEYYKRQLSFQTDIVDAFLGVLGAFNASNDLPWSVTHFYGIPICYGSSPEVARHSFIRSLLWTVETKHNNTIIPTDAFPSWTWASVKAERPSEDPGELDLQVSGHVDPIAVPNDIDIQVCHRTSGSMTISAFVQEQGESRDFQPWLDITTWTQRFKVRILNQQYFPGVGRAELPGFGGGINIFDQRALEIGEIHVLCLRAPRLGERDTDNIIRIECLLVVETSPGLYRRIASSSQDLDSSHIRDAGAGETELSELRFLRRAERYRRLEAGGWLGPQMLEKLGERAWKKRTVRVI
jgi:hypothetical protein